MSSQPNATLAIILYRGRRDQAYVWSPFVNKLEARFRLAGLPYIADGGSPPEAPKRKIPYIGISTPGSPTPMKLLGDSTLITEQLITDGRLKDFNQNLSPVEQVTDLAIRALLEDKLYYLQTYEKWVHNYYTMRDYSLRALNYPLRFVVGIVAYRQMAATFWGQGVMRFTAEEIRTQQLQIWESINVLLVASMTNSRAGDNAPFWLFGGRGPSEADATLFGFVVTALVCDAAPEAKKIVKGFPNLIDYARRIHNSYYPDFALWE